MALAPEDADFLFIIVGILLLGAFFAIRMFSKSDYETRRFRRRLPQARNFEHPGAPDDEEEEEREGQPLDPTLRRVRMQIILAAIGLAALAFIAFSNIGEEEAGLPLPSSWFD